MARILRAIILVALLVGCSGAPFAPANQQLEYTLLNGPIVAGPTDPHVVGDVDVVVEVFVDIHCVWCDKQLPILSVLMELPRTQVVLTYIWSDPEVVTAIVRELQLPYVVLMASDLTAGASGTPHFVIYTQGADGWQIASHSSGLMQGSELLDYVERFLP